MLPFLDVAVGPLTPLHRQLAAVLEMAHVERAVVHLHGRPGRPLAALCTSPDLPTFKRELNWKTAPSG